MDYKLIVPVLISFALSLLMGPVVIPFLIKLKMGQTERVEGVQSHLKKAGTPTMGGVIILGSVLLTSVFYIKEYPKMAPSAPAFVYTPILGPTPQSPLYCAETVVTSKSTTITVRKIFFMSVTLI